MNSAPQKCYWEIVGVIYLFSSCVCLRRRKLMDFQPGNVGIGALRDKDMLTNLDFHHKIRLIWVLARNTNTVWEDKGSGKLNILGERSTAGVPQPFGGGCLGHEVRSGGDKWVPSWSEDTQSAGVLHWRLIFIICFQCGPVNVTVGCFSDVGWVPRQRNILILGSGPMFA